MTRNDSCESAERQTDGQTDTHTHTDGTDSITSTADAGGNKSNICAQAKQVLCEMGKQDVYHRLGQIDIGLMKKQILGKEELSWSENATNISKLELLTKIKP